MTMPAFTAPWALLPWQPAQLASYAFLPAAIDSGVAATGFFSAAAAGFFGCWPNTTAAARMMERADHFACVNIALERLSGRSTAPAARVPRSLHRNL